MSEQLKNDIVAKWKENLQKHLPELTTACSLDPFLSEIAQKNRSHRFMGGAAQTLYQRQVKFLAAILREQFGNKESLTVLDWGCGKGHITYLLKKAGLKVTSCDLPSAFEQKIPIIEKSNITAISLEDPIKIPFENSFFDCVVSFGVLEHVKNDLASMHEVHRILKPGGVFYITFLPYLLSWTQALARARGDTYHDRLYTKKKIACPGRQD